MVWQPYAALPEVPLFTLTSRDFNDGEKMPLPQASGVFGAGGEDRSPNLSWSGSPPQTKSFVITMLDPDAPTVTGIWHWAAIDIPGDVTELLAAAGDVDAAALPGGAFHLQNDVGMKGFLGAAPPEGHGAHRYIFCVNALDVESLDIEPTATPAFMMFALLSHVVGRAFIAGSYER